MGNGITNLDGKVEQTAEVKLVVQGNLIVLRSTRAFFSSPELKAQVSYSDRLLSVVCLSVRLSVNFYIFDFFS
jgi:hypothetical protein